jgi:ketosteroid isomerase-like protein
MSAPRPGTSTARQTVERFLHATIGSDPGDLADFYAPDVIIEMPFAPAMLYPSRIETTREQLRERFRAGTAIRRYTGLCDVVIHETADPDMIIAEYSLQGKLTRTEEPFTLSFLMVITVHDGLIVHSRDYTDPIAGARILGRLPELAAALTA